MVSGTEEHETRSFDLAGKRLEIDSDMADLAIQPGASGKVDVERWVKTKKHQDAVSWTLQNGKLSLRAPCSKKPGGCSVRYKISVPGDSALKIRNHNGDTSVTGLGKGLDIGSANGDVTLKGVSGTMTVGGGNGDVEVEAAKPPDKLEITTENGDASAKLPKAGYRLIVKSGNGDKHVSATNDPNSQRIVSIKSDNGDVTVK